MLPLGIQVCHFTTDHYDVGKWLELGTQLSIIIQGENKCLSGK